MRDQALQTVLDFASSRFGEENVVPYGSDWNDPHGLCLKITSLTVTVSIHTQEGLLSADFVDAQIEGNPPGDFLVCGVVPTQVLTSFLIQIESLPEDQWPTQFDYLYLGQA